jgi:hypothetical protein
MQTKILLFAAALASALVLDARSASALYISEFLALNNSTLRDEDGTYSDWLELHNETAAPANVGGYYLTDNADEPTQWQLPSVSIPAGGHLLVWASNKNRTDPGLPLHTNFALGGTGEFLGLIAPDGTTIVHAYSPQFPEQFPYRSWGLASDLLTERCFFSPTPGEENDETLPCSLVQDVQFSVERGFFNVPFDVTLSTATVGASIRYTLDGSEPTETNGALYTAPVNVPTTTTLRAIAYLAGQVPTRSITHTYIFLDAVLQQSKQTQPPEYQYPDSDYDMGPHGSAHSWRFAFPTVRATTSAPTSFSSPYSSSCPSSSSRNAGSDLQGRASCGSRCLTPRRVFSATFFATMPRPVPRSTGFVATAISNDDGRCWPVSRVRPSTRNASCSIASRCSSAASISTRDRQRSTPRSA